MQIGEKTLTIQSMTPRAVVRTGKATAIEAYLGQTELSGDMVPARISTGTIDLKGVLNSTGLTGEAHANAIAISDIRDDPVYQPLLADFTADFREGGMVLTGPIKTARSKVTVADARMELDLLKLDGNASIISRPLVFEERGFQPTALSDRIRGFLSNARGKLEGRADFEISGGSLAGTGRVEATDFGFDTVRVGGVDGVNGVINFNNLLSLSTPPGQEVRIGSINPGIALSDGLLVFQLIDGREAQIELARWPFAGGTILVEPTRWTVAGTSDVIRVRAEQLELTQLIDILSIPDLKADGTVSGAFPLELVGTSAFIRDARLTADEEGGTIKYTGAIAQQAGSADQRVKYAFDALRDFRFSVLEVGANGNLSGDILVTVKLSGLSPEVLGGAPFEFNIGVDSKLMQLVQSGRRLATSDWITDVVTDEITKNRKPESE